MKIFASALCLALAAGGVAHAAGAADTLMGPAHQFIDSFDKGDLKGAEAAHEASVSIIDEVPPHTWSGPGAFEAWAGDLTKDDKATGKTEESVKLGKVIRAQIDGDTGYLVVHASFLYRQHGKRMVEPAEMTFALHQGPTGWKIAAWTWAGETPHVEVAQTPKAAAEPLKPAAPAPKT